MDTIQDPEIFRQEWFRRFVPADRRELARAVCFPKGDRPAGGSGDPLWHAFGWRYIACLEGPAASAAFRRQLGRARERGKTLLVYRERERAVCLWTPEEAAPEGEPPAFGPDVYIADTALHWTYATGDGEKMGPYFARSI